jgi:hypothetical protein
LCISCSVAIAATASQLIKQSESVLNGLALFAFGLSKAKDDDETGASPLIIVFIRAEKLLFLLSLLASISKALSTKKPSTIQ